MVRAKNGGRITTCVSVFCLIHVRIRSASNGSFRRLAGDRSRCTANNRGHREHLGGCGGELKQPPRHSYGRKLLSPKSKVTISKIESYSLYLAFSVAYLRINDVMPSGFDFEGQKKNSSVGIPTIKRRGNFQVTPPRGHQPEAQVPWPVITPAGVLKPGVFFADYD